MNTPHRGGERRRNADAARIAAPRRRIHPYFH